MRTGKLLLLGIMVVALAFLPAKGFAMLSLV